MAGSDNQLRKAAQGDRQSQDELLRELMEPLHTFLRLRMGDGLAARETVSDIVQSACFDFVKRWRESPYPSRQALRRHLFLQAEHKLVDHVRRFGRLKRSAPTDSTEDAELAAYCETFLTPSRVASAKEQLQRVEHALKQLPEDYRRVILLSKIAQLSTTEIAEEMGRSASAIWTLLSRALARLAVCVDDPDQIS
jgi:RNA polymerase sigma factor (sigma-70 family)